MPTAFLNGLLILGNGNVMERGSVLVEGEKITRVGSGDIRLPANTRRISLGGRNLTPGFIDCHVHLRAWTLYNHFKRKEKGG